jgi:hypothetical protein
LKEQLVIILKEVNIPGSAVLIKFAPEKEPSSYGLYKLARR